MKIKETPRCGWCRGNPPTIEKENLYECLTCHRTYPKPLLKLGKKEGKKD